MRTFLEWLNEEHKDVRCPKCGEKAQPCPQDNKGGTGFNFAQQDEASAYGNEHDGKMGDETKFSDKHYADKGERFKPADNMPDEYGNEHDGKMGNEVKFSDKYYCAKCDNMFEYKSTMSVH